MKKSFFIIFIFIGFNIYAQEDVFQREINECINFLGKPVPLTEFQLIGTVGRNQFFRRGKDNTILIAENNIIVFSSFGYYHQTNDRVEVFNNIVRSLLEKEGWEYYSIQKVEYDVYQKNGVFAGILKPTIRDDGNFSTVIGFSRNLKYLDNM